VRRFAARRSHRSRCRSCPCCSAAAQSGTCSGQYWRKNGRNFGYQGQLENHKNGFGTRRGSNFRPFGLGSSRFSVKWALRTRRPPSLNLRGVKCIFPGAGTARCAQKCPTSFPADPHPARAPASNDTQRVALHTAACHAAYPVDSFIGRRRRRCER